MKLLGYFLIIVIVCFSVKKIIDYFRYLKLHQKQVAQMDELLIELRAKQKVMKEHAKIMSDSADNQNTRLIYIYQNIIKTIKQLF